MRQALRKSLVKQVSTSAIFQIKTPVGAGCVGWVQGLRHLPLGSWQEGLLRRVGAECTGHLLLGDHDDAATLRVCSRHSRPGWPLHYMEIITDKKWKLVQGCEGWVQGGGKGFASRSARPVICAKTK